MKKKFTAKDKAKIVLQALTEQQTLAEIASTAGAHATQVGLWKKSAKDSLYKIFDKTDNETKRLKEMQTQIDELHRLIGQRDEELAWLQKKITQ